MQLKHNKLSSLISHTFATQSLGLFISFAIGIFFNRLLGPEGKGFITY
jgi:hypothetical protein